ncbi:MAG: hypothetical protein ABIQ99_19445 [Thermoflexales bacterium]
MDSPNYRSALDGVVAVFDALGVSYLVAGSVASMAYGVMRTTLDVDVVADLRVEHVRPLAAALSGPYYADLEMIADAVRDRAWFNVIHLETMFKVDVFVLKPNPYDQQAFTRAVGRRLEDLPNGPELSIEAPEDLILNKLRWFELGGRVSERQWGDLIGVLRVNASGLDLAYLQRWAGNLGLDELLGVALRSIADDRS